MAALLGSSVPQFPSPPQRDTPTTPASRRDLPGSSPGQVLASSPLLHDDMHAERARESNNGNGAWPSIQVDDAEDLPSDHGESYMYSGVYDGSSPGRLSARSRSSTFEGELTDSELAEGQGQMGESPSSSYGALSRRAESILRNAKMKLNLLDTNLKGARHSLVAPATSSPNVRAASSASMHLPTISSDEEDVEEGDTLGQRSTKTNNAASLSKTMRKGHTRVYSETSIPSEQGQTPKGSRSLDYIRGKSYDSRSPASRHRAEYEGQLGSVPEDAVEEPPSTSASNRYRSTSVTRDLRTQADDLRQRLALLQARTRDDTRKRNSHRLSSSFGSSSEIDPDVFNNQVKLLEQSLHRQEQVIAELESAEDKNIPAEPVEASRESPQDPRTEWSRVIDHQNQASAPLDGSDGSDDSDEQDEFDLGEEDDMDNENFRDVLKIEAEEREYRDDEQEPMDVPHEEREDVFDYETFILHSTMGAYEGKRPGSSSSSSVASESTPRRDYDDDDDDDYSDRNMDQAADDELDLSTFKHPNESVASFETAHSQAGLNGSSSEDEGRDYDDDDEGDEYSNEGWPMPPSANSPDMARLRNSGEGRRSIEDDKTPTAATFAQSAQGVAQPIPPPTSAIFAALTTPDEQSRTLLSLDETDTALLYSLAENLRNACLHIQESGPGRDADLWRDRLEQARQILGG